jgi:hypothetical protein
MRRKKEYLVKKKLSKDSFTLQMIMLHNIEHYSEPGKRKFFLLISGDVRIELKEGIDYFECELVMYIVKDSCLIEISKITKYINIKLDKDYAESVEKHYCGGYD